MHVAAKGNTAYPGLWEKGMVILIEGGDGAFCLRPWSDKRKAETLMIREADTQLAHTPARDTWDDKLAKARLKRDKVSTGHPSEESNVFGPSQSQQHPCIEDDGTPQRYLALPWLCTPQKDQAEADVRPEHSSSSSSSSSGQVVAVRYGLQYGTVGDTGAWAEWVC
ncbi:hypothetical protein SCAR479_06016 [Seiridium cardinale]|uniref:Uncharacterized protein n=1 Tax=Seiridium cardinale TaxID=138064 RepID=A0ABR2XU57_9PEZI